MTPTEFLYLAVDGAFVMVMVSIALGFYRIAVGPTLADRVVALDMMTVSIVAFCGLYAIFAGVEAFLDVAIVVALIGFLATVALARFAERMMLLRRTPNPKEGTE
ncbi:MAG: pH regulation protein F [Rhodobacteraceae bacterium]|jgi:multisubunit Na+/H+ antiporter MnhF subunit|nr:pH regulation protein F [Alphaproteobacteria bacterium]MBT8475898.1 pH regulation protein F [Alphaproteobacteria bacterium]NNF72401.1 pH regulation protein F [Paracoccaceae bacterium]NNK65849.1 pH regulation protein F [Paracoccaceae bacterium]